MKEKCFYANGCADYPHCNSCVDYVGESDFPPKKTITGKPFHCDYNCEPCKFYNYCRSKITDV